MWHPAPHGLPGADAAAPGIRAPGDRSQNRIGSRPGARRRAADGRSRRRGINGRRDACGPLEPPTDNRSSDVNTADLIWANGELVPWEDAQVHVLTHGLHYGPGLLAGVRA